MIQWQKISAWLLTSLAICNCSGMRSSEWANLQRFDKSNRAIGNPLPGERRVVFMGDSITELWQKEHAAFFTGRPWMNRGISGQVTEQMLLRFQQDVIDLKPAVVVILGGINDIAQNAGFVPVEKTADHIFQMAAMARKAGIRPIICSVLPANVIKWRKNIHPSESIIQLNRLLLDYCNENNITYVDYYTKMVDDTQGLDTRYTVDGVHPVLAGYQIMEPIIEAAINENLAP